MADVNAYYNNIGTALAPQQKAVDTATSQYQNDLIGGSNLTQQLQDALNNKVNNSKDLSNQMATTMADYFQAPSAARVKYADIWDPAVREKLVAGDVAQALQPYDVFSNILKTRTGNLADLVSNGVAGWKAKTDADLAGITSAQNNYSNTMDQYKLANSQYEFAHPHAAAGTAGIQSLIDEFEKQMNRSKTPQDNGLKLPAEQNPAYTPSGKIDPNNLPMSDGGQWIWNPSLGLWSPVIS
jgi:hypothetical protein